MPRPRGRTAIDSSLGTWPGRCSDSYTSRRRAASLLLVGTILALCWANSPWADSYHDLWETAPRVRPRRSRGRRGPPALGERRPDGAVLLRRRPRDQAGAVEAGDLAEARDAALPVVAALGGMVVPAAIYAVVNAGGDGSRGWGIPMATDIAFALGVRRAPRAARAGRAQGDAARPRDRRRHRGDRRDRGLLPEDIQYGWGLAALGRPRCSSPPSPGSTVWYRPVYALLGIGGLVRHVRERRARHHRRRRPRPARAGTPAPPGLGHRRDHRRAVG